ncbi:SDR family NAD(P)-dependent oxidoreductase [Flavilitoribacter nigricans]|uniref:3-hydroxyacyl-CoA dehydrogenase n=1 Tax=Flavilitoribacter nigricans (strain ATCC 23147 / DSM 23189 / NBRC 102662 / NCIMB 1420 / SS-2) TaxID=1122177 RepID=A0A2D0N061_FLAN2|nr:SDR family NAD(P)-dependent oxidoreductase [Flavilitoribacter nigricans]PHN01911.1 3-hydroxyacyl-CoA dehydrogenase [Flavilitoribacter nigricans DSM 23189 = NBRC 102662]
MEIKNKTFLISGGGSGLGLATAQMLAQYGARVAVLDIRLPADSELNAGQESMVLPLQADVRREEQIEAALDKTVATFGPIHGLISCAGIGPAARTLGREGVHSLELFQKVIDTNLVGTFNLIRLTANRMQENAPEADGERGTIIMTASVAAYEGQIGQAAYAASKGGLVSMTLPLARELARIGIRVNTIAPGIFETPLLANLPDEARASLGAQVPFPSRLGQAEEFAALARHIIENRMLNGTVIRLDGGIRMGPK